MHFRFHVACAILGPRQMGINPRLKKVTICASEAKPNRRGKAPF